MQAGAESGATASPEVETTGEEDEQQKAHKEVRQRPRLLVIGFCGLQTQYQAYH